MHLTRPLLLLGALSLNVFAAPTAAPVELEEAQPADIINAGFKYLACYTIYSSARAKRALNLDEPAIEKRCGKHKMAKRVPLCFGGTDPETGVGCSPGGLDGGAPGGDGGAGDEWPGDMGPGYLQCYTTYTTDKLKERGIDSAGNDIVIGSRDEGLEKRCRKEKRAAEDEAIKAEMEKRNLPKYWNYDAYMPPSVPVKTKE